MKYIIKITSVIIILLFTIFMIDFLIPSQAPTAEGLFEGHLISPVPSTVTNLKLPYCFVPTLGDGRFVLTFSIAPSDLKKVTDKCVKNHRLPDPNLAHINNSKELYKFLGKDISSYHYTFEEEFNYLTLYTNSEFTKVWVEFSGFIQNKPILNL